MKNLKVFKLQNLFGFILISLCMLFSNEVLAQSESCDNWKVIAVEGQGLNIYATVQMEDLLNGQLAPVRNALILHLATPLLDFTNCVRFVIVHHQLLVGQLSPLNTKDSTYQAHK